MEEVIERARAGDREYALALLWRTYNHLVLRYFRGRKMAEPDDLASAVWIDVARGLSRFRGDEDDFRRWLFTIAARRRVDAIRSEQRRSVETWQRPETTGRNGEPMAPDTADVADQAAALGRAIALVQQLPDDQAEAVLLRVVADLSVTDVAHIMGRREGHVRVLVHRGLEKLSQKFCNESTWRNDVPTVTANDHTDAQHGDAITRALRSPALPFERDHEAAVLTQMVDAHATAPESSPVRHHRRVLAFAAVTVASLGVGGIIAAGPGGFRPFINDDKPPATTFDDSVPAPDEDEGNDEDDNDQDNGDDDNDGGDDDGGGTDRITTDPDFDCAEGDNLNHGQTVSSAARAPGSNSAAAHSECGKPVSSQRNKGQTDEEIDEGTARITNDPDFDCADGDNLNHGQTVSSAAKNPGPNNAAAQSDCGKPITSGNGNDDHGNQGNGGNGDSNGEDDDGNQGNGGTGNGNSNSNGNDDNGNEGNGNGNQGNGGTGNGNSNGRDAVVTGDDGIPGPPASTPGTPNPGPPESTPGNSDPGPPASAPNNGNTSTTQPAG